MHHIAFEVTSIDELDRTAEDLSARGFPIVTPPTAGLEAGVAKAMRFCDRDGNLVELVVDAVRDAYGSRDVRPVGLNHVPSIFSQVPKTAGR